MNADSDRQAATRLGRAVLTTTAGALFAVGVYSAVTLVGDWRTSGVRMVVIGLGAAAIGFAVGRLFNVGG